MIMLAWALWPPYAIVWGNKQISATQEQIIVFCFVFMSLVLVIFDF